MYGRLRPALAAVLLAFAGAAGAAPVIDISTYQESLGDGSFQTAASTSDILSPTIRITASDPQGLRIGRTPLGVSTSTVALWHFDADLGQLAVDSARGHHASLLCVGECTSQSSATFTGSIDASFDTALLLGATDEYSETPDAADLDFPKEMTVEMWIKLSTVVPTLPLQTIFEKAPDNYGLYVTSSGRLRWVTQSSTDIQTAAGTFPKPDFAHVAVTFSRSRNEKRIYVNGLTAASGTTSADMPSSAGPFSFGQNQSSPDDGAFAVMDEVRISSYAMTQAEIQAGMMSGAILLSNSGLGNLALRAIPSSMTAVDIVLDISDQRVLEARYVHQFLPNFANCGVNQNFIQFMIQNNLGETSVTPVLDVHVSSGIPPIQPTGVAKTGATTDSITFSWNGDPCGAKYAVAHAAGGVSDVTVTSATTVTFPGTPDQAHSILVTPSFSGQVGPTSLPAAGHTLAKAPSDSFLVKTSSESSVVRWSADGNPSDTTYQVRYGPTGLFNLSTFFTGTQGKVVGMTFSAAQQLKVRARNKDGVFTADDVTMSTTTMPPFLATEENVLPNVGSRVVGVTPFRNFEMILDPETFSQLYYVVVTDTNTTRPCGLTANALQIVGDPVRQPARGVLLTLQYTPGELASLGGDPQRLRLARFDEDSGLCVPLATEVDPAARTLRAKVNHFTVIQIQQAPAAPASLAGARVFPNPLFLSRINQGYFTFTGLPADAEVRVYSLRGELLFDGRASGAGQARWDGVNPAGRRVGSGLYLVHFKSGSSERTLKLAIER